jgi:hypothetical protein
MCEVRRRAKHRSKTSEDSLIGAQRTYSAPVLKCAEGQTGFWITHHSGRAAPRGYRADA